MDGVAYPVMLLIGKDEEYMSWNRLNLYEVDQDLNN